MEMIDLAVPEGARDWAGADVIIRDKILTTITDVFKRHGGVAIDTPVFELQEILAGSKTGINRKHMTLDLADQGGEICALRYDLTHSFARWLAMNPTVQSVKCYQIGKIYGREVTALGESRPEEFYRCDFGIAGVHDPMLPDAEVVRIVIEVLQGLEMENYIIRINHRKIIDGIFESCGIPKEMSSLVANAVSKLDQFPWDDIREGLAQKTGLGFGVLNKVQQYVSRKGGRHLQYDLLLEEDLTANESFSSGLKDIALLLDYLEIFGAMPKIQLDLSYTDGYELNYTGVIFGVVAPLEQTGIEAPLAIGGRQDDLVGRFSKGGLPYVGISFDVDRIFGIAKARVPEEDMRTNEVDVYVMAYGEGFLKERIEVCNRLWDAGVKAEFSYKAKPELAPQLSSAKESKIPLAVILSKEKLEQEKAKIVEMGLGDDHPQKTGVDVPLPDLVMEIKKRIGRKRTREDGGDDAEDGFKEHVDRVRVEGGTVEMEGIEIELDFAKIKSRGAEIEIEGAKIKLKKAKIELRGRRE